MKAIIHASGAALLCTCVLLLPSPLLAQGQSALSRLEEQITGGVQVPQAEPGYLGAELDDSQEGGRGIRVLQVVAGSPAEAAGLVAGDLITGANREPVRNLETLAGILAQVPPGNTVSFDVLRQHPVRGAETHKVQATLGLRPSDEQSPFPGFGLASGEPGMLDVVEARFSVFGFAGRAVQQEIPQQGEPATLAAVLVTEVAESTPAADGGLQVGDLVVQANRTTVRTPGELAEVIQAQPRRATTLVIVRDGVARQAQLEALAELAGEATAEQVQRPGTLVLEPISGAEQRIQQLEQRIAALEAELRELKRQLGGN